MSERAVRSPRHHARIAVLINQAAFPGLGSIMMRRRAGWAQAALMAAGFVLTMTFLVWYLWCCWLYLRSTTWDEGQFAAHYRPLKWALHYGLTLCGAAWLWALVSSVGIWRREGSEARLNP